MEYSFLEQIFSVKESYGHKYKVVTILGLHIYIKRYFFWRGKYRPFLTSTHLNDKYIYRGYEADKLILRTLETKAPCMITRFGANEIDTVSNFYEHIDDLQIKFHNLGAMKTNAGFFSATDEQLTRYACEIVQFLHNIDILGIWHYDRSVKYYKRGMHLLTDNCRNTQYVPLGDLLRVNESSWVQYLAGKRVLVIHPFEKTINLQYKKRKLLFNNPDFLPEFDLKTVKAVQGIGNASTGFDSWFDALESMYKKIDEVEFDVALIGAGAYGMHLANYIKNKSKQAIHIGGALQTLFGIKGQRWDNCGLYNEHWISPLPEDTPKDLKEFVKGEGSTAYW